MLNLGRATSGTALRLWALEFEHVIMCARQPLHGHAAAAATAAALVRRSSRSRAPRSNGKPEIVQSESEPARKRVSTICGGFPHIVRIIAGILNEEQHEKTRSILKFLYLFVCSFVLPLT